MDILLHISQCFPLEDDQKHAENVLRKYKLFDTISEILASISNLGERGNLNKAALLNKTKLSIQFINSVVGNIGDVPEKYFVKSVIGKIIGNKIRKVLIPSLSLNDFESWVEQMKRVCEDNGYVFSDLETILGINDLRAEVVLNSQPNKKTGLKSKEKYLEWSSVEFSLRSLSEKLKVKDYIKSSREFEALFSPGISVVRFNSKYFDEIFILMDELRIANYIICKGTKGVWDAIGSRAVDYDRKPFLGNRTPKRIKELISRNENKSNELKKNAESFINGRKT